MRQLTYWIGMPMLRGEYICRRRPCCLSPSTSALPRSFQTASGGMPSAPPSRIVDLFQDFWAACCGGSRPVRFAVRVATFHRRQGKPQACLPVAPPHTREHEKVRDGAQDLPHASEGAPSIRQQTLRLAHASSRHSDCDITVAQAAFPRRPRCPTALRFDVVHSCSYE
jgi:hypothetical protein